MSVRTRVVVFAFFLLCAGVVADPAAASESWYWQNPIPQGNSLRSFSSAGDVCWAVGDAGAVVRSLSAGAFWAQQYGVPGAGTVDFTSVQVVDPDHVWLLRADGVLDITGDGGVTWTQRDIPSFRTMRCLYATSTLDAWAFGDGPTAWHTVDGGKSWRSIDTGGEGGFDAVVAHDGYLYPSGPTRQVRVSMSDESVSVFAIFPLPVGPLAFCGNLVIASGVNHTVFRSDDGGESWASINVKQMAPDSTSLPYFRDKAHVVLFTGASEQYTSSDGGKTWTRIAPPCYDRYGKPVLRSLWFSTVARSGGRLIAVGSHGAILFSKDEGATWHWVVGDFFDELPDASFSSPLDGFLLTPQKLIATTDGGATWHRRAVTGVTDRWTLHRMAVAPDGSGWVVGAKYVRGAPNAGVILHSDDGMNTFREQTIPVASHEIDSVWTNDGRKAWASGMSTTGVLLRTIDGGKHWAAVDFPGGGPTDGTWWGPGSVSVSPTGVGYAATWGNQLLRTTDDGLTWQVVRSFAQPVYWVRMVDDFTVWVGCGGARSIWTNTWPEDDWSSMEVAQDHPYLGVTDAAVLGGDTYLALSAFAIYRSDDAGLTWYLDRALGDQPLRIATASGPTAWVTTSGGGVLYNGGPAGDFTPPETRTHAPAGWTDDDAWVTLVPEDQTGIDGTWWEWGDGSAIENLQAMVGLRGADAILSVYKGPIKVTAEGATSITFYSRDACGNTEAPRTVSVKIDKHAPRLSSDCRPSYAGRAVVHLTARDAASGVRAVCWRLDGGGTRMVRGAAAAVTAGGRGAHRLQVWAKDRAGNVGRRSTLSFNVR